MKAGNFLALTGHSHVMNGVIVFPLRNILLAGAFLSHIAIIYRHIFFTEPAISRKFEKKIF